MHLRHSVLALLFLVAAETTAADLHREDHRACSTCNAALARSMEYLRKNFDKQVATDGWYAGMLNSFWGGFAFLIDGNSRCDVHERQNILQQSVYRRHIRTFPLDDRRQFVVVRTLLARLAG